MRLSSHAILAYGGSALVPTSRRRQVVPSQAQVSWQASLAAFAFVRLLTVLPVTPGGLGVTELGLVGVLADHASHLVTVQVIAAVLLFRALTYVLPTPLGAVAALAWQHAPGLIHAQSREAPPPAQAGES